MPQSPVDSTVTPDDRLVTSIDDLLAVFHGAEKPPSAYRIGAEAEKIAVRSDDYSAMPYEGPRSVTSLFEAFEQLGWEPERETPGGPVIALKRGQASLTLEPGSQFELSGAALPDVHAVADEFHEHFQTLGPISERLGLLWLGVGFHPLATQQELTWVPKQRYAIMREYLPPLGDGAHDMMRRTATVQANFDFSNEADAMKKLQVSLKLSPLIHALLANSPFYEGRVSGKKSVRGDVWLRMDRSRSGLIPSLWKPSIGYRDYAEWALDAGMFLVKRNGQVLANTGQTFRSFMRDGFQGVRATFGDWKLHLNTLFPEARLKSTLEVRGCDCLPRHLSMAVPALFTGILYDEVALDLATELAAPFTFETVERARPALVTHGLATNIGDTPAQSLAERLYEIAWGGLTRRARRNAAGEDETVHLAPLRRLLERGESPADDLTRGLQVGQALAPAEIVQRARI